LKTKNVNTNTATSLLCMVRVAALLNSVELCANVVVVIFVVSVTSEVVRCVVCAAIFDVKVGPSVVAANVVGTSGDD